MVTSNSIFCKNPLNIGSLHKITTKEPYNFFEFIQPILKLIFLKIMVIYQNWFSNFDLGVWESTYKTFYALHI